MSRDEHNGFIFERKGGRGNTVAEKKKCKEISRKQEAPPAVFTFQVTSAGGRRETLSVPFSFAAPGGGETDKKEKKEAPKKRREKKEFVKEKDSVEKKIDEIKVGLSSERRTSVFKSRRESLFGYEHIHSGMIDPAEFHKHSNESQCRTTRIKQILLWSINYISKGDAAMGGLRGEELKRKCEAVAGKVRDSKLVLDVSSKREMMENPINERARVLVEKTRREISRYKEEIERWRAVGESVLKESMVSLPLGKTKSRRESCRESLRPCGFVSFEATSLALEMGSGKIFSVVTRKMEEMNTALNSLKYYVFLSLEYTDRVYNGLLDMCYRAEEEKDPGALLVLLSSLQRDIYLSSA
jgi:hypothetical protein